MAAEIRARVVDAGVDHAHLDTGALVARVVDDARPDVLDTPACVQLRVNRVDLDVQVHVGDIRVVAEALQRNARDFGGNGGHQPERVPHGPTGAANQRLLAGAGLIPEADDHPDAVLSRRPLRLQHAREDKGETDAAEDVSVSLAYRRHLDLPSLNTWPCRSRILVPCSLR